MEMGSLGETNRQIIDTTKLPDYVSKAIVASEDRTFTRTPALTSGVVSSALSTPARWSTAGYDLPAAC